MRAIPESELVARLDDHLWAVDGRAARASGTEPRYPRAPQAYVDHWTHPDQGWLRAWYPPGSAEPHYDATPAVEQAVRWVASLRGRGFVGTESRLNTVFELLRQLAVGTQTDPAERLRELEERRAAIDDEIAQVRAGRVAVLDAAAQRDRYQQLTQTAADLLSDFREVEANFAPRPRAARAHHGLGRREGRAARGGRAVAHGHRGVGPGRSFHAFYDFLLDRRRQEEFAALVERVQSSTRSRPTSSGRPRDAGPGRGRRRAGRGPGAGAPAPAPRPLRLARRRGADPGDRADPLRAAPSLPRRPGVAREPTGHGHPARRRGEGARRARRRPRGRPRRCPAGDAGGRRRARGRAADGAAALHAAAHGPPRLRPRRGRRRRLRGRRAVRPGARRPGAPRAHGPRDALAARGPGRSRSRTCSPRPRSSTGWPSS